MIPTAFDIVFPLAVLLLLGIGVPAAMVGANWFLFRQRKSFVSKEEPYECGLSRTIGTADERFSSVMVEHGADKIDDEAAAVILQQYFDEQDAVA